MFSLKFCLPPCFPQLLEKEHKATANNGGLVRLPAFIPQGKENKCLRDIK